MKFEDPRPVRQALFDLIDRTVGLLCLYPNLFLTVFQGCFRQTPGLQPARPFIL
jgi:hypothetical protein